MKIGVFDSGLGGLAILKDIFKVLPQYDYIYLGDNARVPYGGKSAKLIYKYTKKAVEFLFKKGCALVILACNTATATSLRKIQRDYLPKYYPDRRVLGVIRPTVEVAIESGAKRVGVMGTQATIISKKFVAELMKFDDSIKVYQSACPLLVPIIEEGEIHWEGLRMNLKKYLTPLVRNKVDLLILGCTHYGLIDKEIKKLVGNKIKLISEGKVVAAKLKNYLQRHLEIESKLRKNKKRMYFVTDYSERYKKQIKIFLGDKFRPPDKLHIAKYA